PFKFWSAKVKSPLEKGRESGLQNTTRKGVRPKQGVSFRRSRRPRCKVPASAGWPRIRPEYGRSRGCRGSVLDCRPSAEPWRDTCTIGFVLVRGLEGQP